MPHTIAIDDTSTGALGDADHATVYVCRHANHEALRYPGAQPIGGPRRLHCVWVTADSSRGNQDGAPADLEIAHLDPRGLDAAFRVVLLEHLTPHADGAPSPLLHDQLVDAVSELELH